MKKNNKTARKSPSIKARALSSTAQANLAAVRNAAFQSGTSRNAVIAAVAAALGRKPVLTLYNAGKLELQIGFMAAALARKGDNREPAVLMSDCRTKLTKYQGFGGTAKLREGQLGRRSKAEEEAYGSARVQVTAIMREAAVTVPETRGGNTSSTRKPQAGKVKGKAGNDNVATKPLVARCKSREELLEYAQKQAAAMLATVNRSAKATGVSDIQAAISAFAASIKSIK